MRMRFAALLLTAVLMYGASEGPKQPIVTTDLLKIRRVTEVQVARDGSFAVYGVQSIHSEPGADPKAEPAYSYRTHLFYIDLNDPSAKPVQLTFGDRSDGGLALSPDGRTLMFTRMDATQKDHPHSQVWSIPLRAPGEAQMITHLENGASTPRFRPDGKALLVTSSIPISKLEGTPTFDLERPKRAWLDWDRPKPDDKDKQTRMTKTRKKKRKSMRVRTASVAQFETGWSRMPRRRILPKLRASTSWEKLGSKARSPSPSTI